MSVRNTKIIIVVFFFAATSGCKKHPFDYRNKFLGDYSFSVHKTTWGPNTDTTYSYDGKIWYGSGKENVSITFSENISLDRVIYEDGSLQNTGGGASYYYGEFETTKKIKFVYSNGALGGGTKWSVTGEKK